MELKCFSVGDVVRWKSYNKYCTGTIEKIVPESHRPLKVRPHEGFRPSLSSIKAHNAELIKRK